MFQRPVRIPRAATQSSHPSCLGRTCVADHGRHRDSSMGVPQEAPQGSWLARMMTREPPMLGAIALAIRMARGIWAMMTRQKIIGLSWLSRADLEKDPMERTRIFRA